MLSPDTPLSELKGAGSRVLEAFRRLSLHNVRDLLYYFPFRYEDFSNIKSIGELRVDEQATVHGIIEEVGLTRSWRKRMLIVQIILKDKTGSMRAVWFNQPYLTHILRRGRKVSLAGKVCADEKGFYFQHPAFELSGKGEPRHTGRLVPIYPETKWLTSKMLRFLIQHILNNVKPIPEWLPDKILEQEELPELMRALANIHFPKTIEEALRAKRRFAFEDLLLLHLTNIEIRLGLRRAKARRIPRDLEAAKRILADLPFELTNSQKRSLWEIMQDLDKTYPMNRLLQGDVGSGKTVVALIAALLTSREGYQTAFMAPTEVLAQQHFETIRKLFARLKEKGHTLPQVGLLTGSGARLLIDGELESKISKNVLQIEVGRCKIPIVVGTHALIQKTVRFCKLGLVVIDEQHRFGVRQRAALIDDINNTNFGGLHKQETTQNSTRVLPHLLSMSATPIPRTLMLTIFGDLNLSLIDELPAGRKKIITKIVPPEKRGLAYEFIKKQIAEGRQVFVICPRIEAVNESANGKIQARLRIDSLPDKTSLSRIQARDQRDGQIPERFRNQNFKSRLALEIKSVKEEYERLSKNIFPDFRVAMLHGKLKAKEKEKIIKDFREGRTDILVSTSVVEVGVDIPNATVMMIEGSERFGLAQLYQFRGRVGRGEHQSYCLLFTDSNSKATRGRLEALVQAKNGFELAEIDLRLRGPGEFLGEEQTGFPDLAMKALQDPDLVRKSRAAAAEILKNDPTIKKHPRLKMRLKDFEKRVHLE